ncbi:MAG: hypothetical protein F6K31_12330 [Symploca sp. SIO2G7]|nr:hypothetical protein [Symploca sp. SIO2G7]
MGEAKRRKALDPNYGKPSAKTNLQAPPSVIPVAKNPEDNLLGTTVESSEFGSIKVLLGEVFLLKDAPEILRLAKKCDKQIEYDKWYSPVVFENSSGQSAQGILFYAPPYNNVRIGIIWVKTSWENSVLLKLDKLAREVIPNLIRVRITEGAFKRK